MVESIRITQKDVARAAGVSQATVSTVLNGGRAVVAQETAERIHAAIADLGYSPNRFAQALRTQKTMVIACVVPDLTNPFYPSLFTGVQRVSSEAGYDLVAIDTGGDRAQEMAVVNSAMQGRYDGVVGVFFSLSARDFERMISAGVPLVRIEASRKAGGPLAIDDLFVDNLAAAGKAVEALIALGHRDIAMLAGKGGPQAVRVEGYRRAVDAAGRAPSIWLDDSFTTEGGRQAARRLVASDTKVTAVFAANDLMALGAMQEFASAGIGVPGNISVMGFDDIMAAGFVTPGLSTVAVDQQGLGRRAAEMLLARISGDATGPGRTEEGAFRLMTRGSVAAPPSPNTKIVT